MPRVTLTVNGETRSLEIEPRRLLTDVLRQDFGCFGVHFGCSHGACGCCTIHIDGAARLSCLAFAAQCDGAQITTIEGLAPPGALHPLQQAFIDRHGLQCGYCTPGFIMALAPFVETAANPSDEEIREAMSGNICRCTGYHTIVEAVRMAIEHRAQEKKIA
jgi:aerobic-type carbon monoxide dehydrogenase small subunit (CoxS/CutS family)